MAAELIIDLKRVLDDGSIVQIRIWRLPQRSAERPHGLKYSLFYRRAGRRIVGYDNETGKGDHRHYGSREAPYRFVSLEQLIEDFWNDVTRERRKAQ
jgi:hypothetical protein